MITKRDCNALAKQIGCTLEINQKSRHVTIWLPDGKQVEGNRGLDCLCNGGETLDDVWPLVHRDLLVLADGGMEPLESDG